MSIPQPSAATLARQRVAPSSAEASAQEESLCAHAWRSLRTTVSAAVTAVLDAGIAVLQRWRKQAGGAQKADRDDGEDRPRSRTDRPGGGRRDATEADAEDEAPRPRRRLRTLLVYFAVLLAGGMGGGALAYSLLEELLDRKTAEGLRMEAEKKLETSAAEYMKAAAEKQKRLDVAVKLLDTIITAERAVKVQPPGNRGSASSAGSKATPLKTGKCTLDSGKSADTLKDCLEDFNR